MRYIKEGKFETWDGEPLYLNPVMLKEEHSTSITELLLLLAGSWVPLTKELMLSTERQIAFQDAFRKLKAGPDKDGELKDYISFENDEFKVLQFVVNELASQTVPAANFPQAGMGIAWNAPQIKEMLEATSTYKPNETKAMREAEEAAAGVEP